MDISHVLLYAIVPIIVVMLAGYISGKKGAFTGADAKKFNKVVLDFALPAALFVSIVQATREDLTKDAKLTIVSAIGIMACFMLVYFVFRMFKKNTGADAAVSALISGSPTIGFLGFAVLEPIFGTSPSVALVVAIVGIVVNAIGIPVGLSLMNAS
ncbi:MAG: AEC family transporter, partial [Muribaculaceae bacterium]|nr:AEC family transporter [Muribaculaceae bacterium]